MKLNKIGLFFLLVMLAACDTTPVKVSKIATVSQTGFLTYTGDFSNDAVAIHSVSYANKTSGEILVEFNLLNKSDQALQVKYLLSELATAEGLRSSPEYSEELPMMLEAGKEARYSLKYLPTNSRSLYSQIGYIGDLKPSYELPLEFMGLKGESLVLKADPTAHQTYLTNFGKEKSIRIYQIVNGKEWQSKQQGCMKQPAEKFQASSVSIHDREILIQGVVCKLSLYQSNEQLHLRLRLANQGDQLLNAIPERLVLKSDTQTAELDAMEILSSNRKNPVGKGLVLRKGERYQIDCHYKLMDSNQLIISNLGIFKEENEQKPLLCVPLEFSIPTS